MLANCTIKMHFCVAFQIALLIPGSRIFQNIECLAFSFVRKEIALVTILDSTLTKKI